MCDYSYYATVIKIVLHNRASMYFGRFSVLYRYISRTCRGGIATLEVNFETGQKFECEGQGGLEKAAPLIARAFSHNQLPVGRYSTLWRDRYLLE